MKAKGVIRIVAVAMLAGVAIPLLLAACGHRSGQVAQLTLTPPAQQAQDISGTEGEPSGEESEPTGTEDEGGGEDDVLVMKYYPG